VLAAYWLGCFMDNRCLFVIFNQDFRREFLFAKTILTGFMGDIRFIAAKIVEVRVTRIISRGYDIVAIHQSSLTATIIIRLSLLILAGTLRSFYL